MFIPWNKLGITRNKHGIMLIPLRNKAGINLYS
jgi:hypothetical protein